MNRMWVTQLNITYPVGEKKGFIQAKLLPYDGNFLLLKDTKIVQLALDAEYVNNVPLYTVLTQLAGEAQRQAKVSESVQTIRVLAADPTKPVVAIFHFPTTVHRIPDCFSLCVSDSTFSNRFQTALGFIASLAGLQIGNP